MLNIILLESKNPYWNLAYENCLMVDASRNPNDEYLVFYENMAGIVLGRSQIKNDEIYNFKKLKYCVKRFSGGGAVYHGYGNLNYALLLSLQKYPQLFAIHESYNFILSNMTKALSSWQKLYMKGLSDVSMKKGNDYRKISGSAQYRKKNAILHHGTFILNNTPLAHIEKYLRQPLVQPEYRENRSHKDFLASFVPTLNQNLFIRLIAKHWIKVLTNNNTAGLNLPNYKFTRLRATKMFQQYGTTEHWKNSILKLQQ